MNRGSEIRPEGVMAGHGESINLRAMAMRENTKLRKSWAVDVLFPNVLGGKVDTWSVDEGMAAFLTGLVRAISPRIVLETGTHKGRSTRAIMESLVPIQGHLYTVDMDDYGLLTSGAIREHEKPHVTQVIGKTPEIFAEEPLFSLRGIELAFLDGDHSEEGVKAELEYVDAHRDGPCFVIVDNAHDSGYPDLMKLFENYTAYPHFTLETCCGLEMIRMG